jgi:collagenase-like PrtC family protease
MGCGVSVSFALNEFYAEGQFIKAREQINKALDCGVEAFIVADIGIMEELKQYMNKVKVYVGVGGTAFNSRAIQFYKKQGAARVILPRHLRLEEIKTMRLGAENKEIQLECLIMNERCNNIDGFCNFEHGIFSYSKPLNFVSRNYRLLAKMHSFLPNTAINFIHTRGMKRELSCCFDYKVTERKNGIIAGKSRLRLKNFFNADKFLNACGACALYDFSKMNIDFVKIVGRVLFKNKVKDVEFIRACLKLLEDSSLGRELYRKLARDLYKKYFKIDCQGFYCYYPS